MHQLDSVRLKLKRAGDGIYRLGRRQSTFRQNTHYRITKTDVNPKTGNYIYSVQVIGRPPSPQWGVAVGEIAHNLRSSLNYLAFQLALLHSPMETVTRNKRLQFPIFKDRKEFRDYGRPMIRLLKPKHQAMIQRLQPYQRSDLNHPLLWLEDINNADKHRLIQVVDAQWAAGPVMLIPFESEDVLREDFRSTILEDGAKFMEAPPNVVVDSELFPLIAFASGCEFAKGHGVIFVLASILDEVEDIVKLFTPEF